MDGQFTYYCKLFYDQMLKLFKQENRFELLLEFALPYTGQTTVSELDEILNCNDYIQKARARADETRKALFETEKIIIKIMDHFEIPPETKLYCQVPGEVELMLYRKENNRVYMFKERDLAPLPGNENMIVIKLSNGAGVDDEDDDLTVPWTYPGLSTECLDEERTETNEVN